MKLPVSVKIGTIDYAIRENPRYKAENLIGQIMYYESAIEIQTDLAPGMVQIGLWHEMLHGLLLQGGFREHDERLLDVLAYGIVRLLQDNPFLNQFTEKTMQPMKPMGKGKGKPVGKAGSKGKGAATCKNCGKPMTKGHKC
jgi:hypothetical protein